jgi:magnesium-protoporphyrin O-methyltransferase
VAPDGTVDTRGVPGCCDPRGCDGIFGSRFAARRAKRYRRRGLDRTEQRMVDFLAAQGLDGASVLEIGGGVGEIHLELLRRGAARATNLELVTSYDAEARRLAAQAGVADRVVRRVVDIASGSEPVERADVVVLHRVVCCYPDYERLLGAAADHAGRALVFSHPPRNIVSRSAIGLQNTVLGLTGKAFRAFAHPPEAMRAVLRERGLHPAYAHHGMVWQVLGLVRDADAASRPGAA